MRLTTIGTDRACSRISLASAVLATWLLAGCRSEAPPQPAPPAAAASPKPAASVASKDPANCPPDPREAALAEKAKAAQREMQERLAAQAREAAVAAEKVASAQQEVERSRAACQAGFALLFEGRAEPSVAGVGEIADQMVADWKGFRGVCLALVRGSTDRCGDDFCRRVGSFYLAARGGGRPGRFDEAACVREIRDEKACPWVRDAVAARAPDRCPKDPLAGPMCRALATLDAKQCGALRSSEMREGCTAEIARLSAFEAGGLDAIAKQLAPPDRALARTALGEVTACRELIDEKGSVEACVHRLTSANAKKPL